MKEIHKDQSTIPDSAYKQVKGSLNIDTVDKLKAASKQIVPKKKKIGTQKTLME